MTDEGQRASPSASRWRSFRAGRATPPGRRRLEEPDVPAPRRKLRLAPLLVAAGVLALALAMTGIVFAARTTRSTGSSGGGGVSATSPAGAVSAPPTARPSDAVRGYLEALAAGDADRALSYSETPPADRTFLTAAVLQASSKLAPLGAIDVPEVTDDNASRVPARFSLGGRAHQRDFEVTRSGDAWKVKDTVTTLALGAERKPNLKMIMNGVEVTTDVVTVFPGTYVFSTGSRWVSWGASDTITVADPRAVPTPTLEPTLTPAGRDAVLSQTRTAFQACLAQHLLAAPGCPNQLQKSQGKRIVESSIRWRVTNDPFRDVKVGLDPANPSLARGRFATAYRIKATVRSTDRPVDAEIVGLPSFQTVADLSKDPVAVTLRG